ncbi:DUF2157 domain-containing protein [Pedobacter endophyticus]|uniref:DUF2157 domain-containing protein n=1 Tax=Pedobacter endophyticus TaxID=2789740 RepID=A0A7S9L2K8_9SPHI|nr:DUF2157 domain-containing protein [Pedobacter endophyticus]QPH41326.1 DUF2157 domain-containing protein [Pedobacter endophyticus]
MKVDREKSEFLDDMIEQWQTDGLISEETSTKLRKSYEAKSFDWLRLAQYAFWTALACGFIALGSLLIDNSILNYIKRIYDTPNIVIALVSGGLAAWLYLLGFRRKRKQAQLKFNNEAILFSAILLTANAIAYLGKALDHGSGNFSILILVSVFIYGILGYLFNSRLIWIFALISLGAWFGTETGYLSRWNYYFLGMNYPLRFVVFGAVLTAASFVMKVRPKLQHFFQVTYIAGMVYLFVALWALSVFGNFASLEEWYAIRQLNLFYWALISAAVCVASTLFGLKYHDDIAREFGITFLFINLYTRYFEYFWDSWHKALFFAVLAASFWLIGRKAEKIWNVEFLK